MQPDNINTEILLNHKPEVSDRFFCQNCQIDRHVKDRRDKVLDLKGRKHKVVGCIYCKSKKL